MTTKRRKYVLTGTRNALLRDAFRQLEAAGVPDSEPSAEWLACEAFGCSRVQLFSQPQEAVSQAAREHFDEMLARRISREPVQYILGYVEFMGLRLAVDSNVLVPRPETEQVVERAIERLESRGSANVLDIGTGSGCIGLAINHFCPDASVIACDISTGALRVARSNGQSLASNVGFVRGDVLDPHFAEVFETRFDLIVSNPPYVPQSEIASIMPEVRDHEPHEALFVDGDPVMYYRAIVDQAPTLLADGGWLLLEVHSDYASEVKGVLSAGGFEETAVLTDLAGRDRIVEGRSSWS